jgi:hypothetical protein
VSRIRAVGLRGRATRCAVLAACGLAGSTWSGGAASAAEVNPAALFANPASSSPLSVVGRHLTALNGCDLTTVGSLWSEQPVVMYGDGFLFTDREPLIGLTNWVCGPFPDGLQPLVSTVERAWRFGNTVMIMAREDAPFLAEPYRIGVAYVIQGGKIVAQTDTFGPIGIQFGAQRPNWPF